MIDQAAIDALTRSAGRPGEGAPEPLVAVSVRVTQAQREWIRRNGALALRKAIAYAMWIDEQKSKKSSQTT